MKKHNFDRTKWTIWAVLTFAFVVVFFHRYSTAVVAEDLASDLNLTGTQLSNLASMYFWAYAIMQIPNGILIDTIGPKKTTSLGMLLAGIGSIMFGLASNITMAYIGRLLVGIGVAGVFVSILKMQAVWFKKEEFPMITGWSSLVGNFGGVLATTPLALLVLAIGWRYSFVVIASVSFVCFALILLFVKDHPSDIGFRSPNGDATITSERFWVGLWKVLKNPRTWPNFFILFALMGSITSFSGLWGVPYLMHIYGLSSSAASRYVLLLTTGIMAGSVLIGTVAKRLGKIKRVILTGCSIFIIIWFYIIVICNGQPPLWQLPLLYLTLGISAICFMLSFTNVKEVNNPHLAGTATSVANVGGFLGGALLNIFVGYILDLNWNGIIINGARVYCLAAYKLAFTAFLVMGIVALVATLMQYEEK